MLSVPRLFDASGRSRALALVIVVTAMVGCDAGVEPVNLGIKPNPIVINGDTHSTDWSEYATGLQPSDFSQIWDPTPFFTVILDPDLAGNKLLQWSASGQSRNRWGLTYNGAGDIANQEVFTDVRVRSLGTGTTLWFMGSAAVRMTGSADNEGGYAVWFTSAATTRNVVLSTWQGGAYHQLAVANIDWALDTWYSVRLRAVGTSIQARIWPRGAVEPTTWSMSVTDTRWSAGRPGVANHDNGVVQWDNWAVTLLPPPPPPVLTSISITPATTTISLNSSAQFVVSGTMSDGSTSTPAVTYSASGGNVTPAGVFTASATGTYSVVATSTVNPTLQATAVVTVNAASAGNTRSFNFTDESVGAAPTGWVETAYPAASDWTVVNDGSVADTRVLRNIVTATNRHVLRSQDVSDTTTTQEVLTKIRLADSDSRGSGVILRHRMNGSSESGYVAYLRPSTGRVEINAFVNSAWSFISDAAFINQPGVWYWLRFRAEGSTLRLRVWQDGTAEPATWTREATHTALTSGAVGLYTYEPNTIDYDFVSIGLAGEAAPLPVVGPPPPPPPPPTETQLVLTPATVSSAVNGTVQFVATSVMSNGTTPAANATFSATGGTITSSGLFTAGAAPGVYAVIATSITTPSLADTSLVTIVAAPVLASISLTPATVTLTAGATAQFSVSGQMSDGSATAPSVTYSATGGSVSASGLYTAGSVPGTYVVVATSTVNTNIADTSSVTINAPPVAGAGDHSFAFAEGVVGSAPAGWTETAYPANSDWTLAADASAADGRMLRNIVTSTSRHVLRLDAVPDTSTAQEVLVRMRMSANNGRGPGVILRHRMAGSSESGYVAYFRPSIDRVEINSFNNGVWAFIGDAAFVNNPGTWYWLRFRAEGNVLRMRVWADGSSEPSAWTVQANNAALVSGSAGMYTYESNTVDYDWFSYASALGSAASPSIAPPSPFVQLSLTPATVTLNAGATQQFQVAGTRADGTQGTPPAVFSATGGSVSSSGLFTAGNTAGTFQVVATSSSDATLTDTSVVTVVVPPPPTLISVSMTPAIATTQTGGVVQFNVSGQMSNGTTVVPAVTYTATSGSISSNGLFTAPSVAGPVTVVATSSANSSLADTSVVQVNAPPPVGANQWFTDFSLGTVGAPMPDLRKVRSGLSWAFNAIVRDDAAAPGQKVLKLEGPNPAGNGSSRPHAWTVVPVANEQEIVVKLRTSNTIDPSGGAFLSGSVTATGVVSEYGSRLRGGRLQLWNYKSNSYNAVETAAPDWVAGQWMWIRMRLSATNVTVRYWRDGNPEPTTWHLTTARDFGSGPAIAPGAAGIYMNTVGSGVEFGAIGAAINGATAPTSGTVTMGVLQEPETSGGVYSSSFASETVGQTPTGWSAANVTTNVTWNVATVNGSAALRTIGSSVAALRLLDYLPMSDATTDQEVLMRVRPGSVNASHTVGAALRMGTGANANTLYGIALGAQNIDYVRWVNGSRTWINSGVPMVLDTNVTYWIRARIEGSNLMAKVWRIDEPEPGSWFRIATDTTIPTGSAGILHWQPDTVDITSVTIRN